MLVKIMTCVIRGVEAFPVVTEVHISQGIRFFIVGLADHAIRESQQRIESALSCNGFTWPRHRVVINLSPANLRKEGSHFDLPIALGLLAASGQVNLKKLGGIMAMGELALDGEVLPVRGVLPMALLARELGYSWVLVPANNYREASLVNELEVVAVSHIKEAVQFMEADRRHRPLASPRTDPLEDAWEFKGPDFSDVAGQEQVKRAMLIAAAGQHNLLLIGPPGAGKSMMASRLPGILPPMTREEALETTCIHSVAGNVDPGEGLVTRRPFRSPHHRISDIAMIGGGASPQPGEISLAHNGILFLDELPEFKRHVLEVLRQPLEERSIHVSRARYKVEYPANFLLVAAMNPCPCGYHNHPHKECHCGPGLIKHYLSRISGPLLDRIDLHVEVAPVPFEKLGTKGSGHSSSEILEQVLGARQVQLRRFRPHDPPVSNAALNAQQVEKWGALDVASRTLLGRACNELGLSARAYMRIRKIARTIADLEASDRILPAHVAEAVSYRNLDRTDWSG